MKNILYQVQKSKEVAKNIAKSENRDGIKRIIYKEFEGFIGSEYSRENAMHVCIILCTFLVLKGKNAPKFLIDNQRKILNKELETASERDYGNGFLIFSLLVGIELANLILKEEN